MSYPIPTSSYDQDFAAQAPSAGNQFDAKKIVHKVVSILPWALLGLVISTIAANLYLRYTPSKHKVAAFILIKKESEANIDYKLLKTLDVEVANSDVQNQMDILKSYTLMERVVDSLKLNFYVRQEGRVSGSELYGYDRPFFLTLLDQDDFIKPCTYTMMLTRDGFTIESNEDGKRSFKYGDTVTAQCGRFVLERNPQVKINPKGYTLQVTDKYGEANGWRGALGSELTNDKGGNIIEISLMDEIPERSVDILNKLIQVFNEADLADKNIVTQKTIKFLTERVDSVSQELGLIESRIELYKRQNKITNLDAQGGLFQDKILAEDKEKIAEYGQYKLLESLERFINGVKNANDIIPSSMGVSEATLSRLILQHNDLVFQKQQLENISTPNDPRLKQATNDVFLIRENILKNIRQLKTAYESKYRDLEETVSGLDNRIASLPEKERELLRLKRIAGVKESLYLYLLQKKEEAQLSLASKINNTRVIDYAIDQGAKTPNRTQIKLLALIVGLVIPVGIVLLLDFLNNKITEKQQIESATQLPIIGELSFVKNNKWSTTSVAARTEAAEQFRILRTNLTYAFNKKRPQKILVTSFISGEGKSYVSMNVASSLALTGAKVVILEFDLRKPKLAKHLKARSNKGLSTYLAGEGSLESVIQQIENHNNIYLISSGPIPNNPAELLIHDKTSTLFNRLSAQFDYIIIDTAPIGLVTDALLLEKFADVTLFVIRHQFTLKAVLPYVEKLRQEEKFRNMNLIVNGVRKDGSYGFGFGLGNSYGYYIHEKRNSFKQKLLRFFQ